jgi:hypothetical protein
VASVKEVAVTESVSGVLFVILGLAMIITVIVGEPEATNLHRLGHYVFGGVWALLGGVSLWSGVRAWTVLRRHRNNPEQLRVYWRAERLRLAAFRKLVGGTPMLLIGADLTFHVFMPAPESQLLLGVGYVCGVVGLLCFVTDIVQAIRYRRAASKYEREHGHTV